nr:PPOX class F420-dependent oxidoreductase [Actinopolyspora halophila]
MPAMSDEQYREFLTTGTRTAKLATTRSDGRPHVVPVWFVLDGDDLVTVTAKDSVKGRALLRDGRVAVCVDDDRRPYAFVMIEGATATSENPEEVLLWSTRNAARYMGEDNAERYGRLNAGAGMMLVRITPTKILSEDDVTEE